MKIQGIVLVILVLHLILTANSITVFNIVDYGAIPNQDISEALVKAWKNATASPKASQVLIPRGDPINLFLNSITNSIIQNITTKDSKFFHANCISSRNVTFQRFTVSAPGDSPNTDGVHIPRCSNITVIDSAISTGDDCISMGDDLRDVVIKNVARGPGHGISINSTTNGVRVKTFRSSPVNITVSDLHFIDLTMVNASNPIIFDQNYCPNKQCSSGQNGSIQISDVEINNVTGTSATQNVITFNCSQACQQVKIGTIDLKYVGKKAATTFCKNITPNFFPFTKQNPPDCRFNSV